MLELISSDFLICKVSKASGGRTDKDNVQAWYVSRALAFCAREFELPKYLLLGKGEDMTGGQKQGFYCFRCYRSSAWGYLSGWWFC